MSEKQIIFDRGSSRQVVKPIAGSPQTDTVLASVKRTEVPLLTAIYYSVRLPSVITQIFGIKAPLFVFSISDLKQNARSLLTSVSDTVFNALSHGSLGFAVHGSFFNLFLIGQHFLTTNQKL